MGPGFGEGLAEGFFALFAVVAILCVGIGGVGYWVYDQYFKSEIPFAVLMTQELGSHCTSTAVQELRSVDCLLNVRVTFMDGQAMAYQVTPAE